MEWGVYEGEYDLDVGKKWVSGTAIRHTRHPVLTLGTVKRSSFYAAPIQMIVKYEYV